MADCHPHWVEVEGLPATVVTITCTTCGDYVPLGPARKTTRREMRLAGEIADICRLWEPGVERSEWIREVVEAHR